MNISLCSSSYSNYTLFLRLLYRQSMYLLYHKFIFLPYSYLNGVHLISHQIINNGEKIMHVYHFKYMSN